MNIILQINRYLKSPSISNYIISRISTKKKKVKRLYYLEKLLFKCTMCSVKIQNCLKKKTDFEKYFVINEDK